MQGAEKKSSSFGKLKGFFVNEEPTPKQTVAPEPMKAPVYTPPSSTQLLDPRYKEKLDAAIQAAQLPGVEYLKFRKSVEDLKMHVTDEPSRFKTAFISLQAFGIVKDKLIDTVDHYVGVLEQENKKFTDAVDEKTRVSVGGNEIKIVDLDRLIAEKTQAIQSVQQEIIALNTEKQGLSQSVQEEKAKIESSKNSWAVVFNSMTQEIKNDKTKMQSYL